MPRAKGIKVKAPHGPNWAGSSSRGPRLRGPRRVEWFKVAREEHPGATGCDQLSGNLSSQGVSYRAEGCVAQGVLRRERCLPDTGRPPGLFSQVLSICDSARVRLRIRGTHGNKIESNVNKIELMETLEGVAALGDERPEEIRSDSLGKEPDKAQLQAGKIRVKYSGAARRCYKKQKQGERNVAEKPISKSNPASIGTPGTEEPAATIKCKRHRSKGGFKA